MDKAEIQRMYEWIQDRVNLDKNANEIAISFNEPNEKDFLDADFDPQLVKSAVQSEWWSEMVTDIVETPEYAEPGESPEKVLEYARDVVVEYVRKRLFT